MTLKMWSRSRNHCQIFVSRHLGKLVQDNYKYRNSLNIIRCETIATHANTNVYVVRFYCKIPFFLYHKNDIFDITK